MALSPPQLPMQAQRRVLPPAFSGSTAAAFTLLGEPCVLPAGDAEDLTPPANDPLALADADVRLPSCPLALLPSCRHAVMPSRPRARLLL